ncbi:MAG: tRNA 5-carboxymethoxyuridine methyltransferase, partial [Pseudomonadota bacterium]|nr:tRNA 5-carboxymethoxyuridine methyltransferase [Pseudomonadota bacterium]
HILWRDLQEGLLNQLPVQASILDAGGGIGQLSQRLGKLGHRITLCEISGDMLKLARDSFAADCPEVSVQFVHCPVQELSSKIDGQFDAVLCHAVLEWLATPRETLAGLLQHLKPGGYLSLAFYNRHSLVYRNLLRGNFRKIINGDWRGDPGSLTPTHALFPDDVMGWLRELDYNISLHSGIRVFSDYLEKNRKEPLQLADIIEMELRFSRTEPYRSLGRYIHLLARKPL